MAGPVSLNGQTHYFHFFRDMPTEVLTQICSRVGRFRWVHSALLTDRFLSNFISPDQNPIWETVFKFNFPHFVKTQPSSSTPKDDCKRLKIRDNNFRENRSLKGDLDYHNLTVNEFSSLKVFNLKSGQELYTLYTYEDIHGPGASVGIHDGVLYASDGSKVKTWDFNKSPHEEKLSLLKELEKAVLEKREVAANGLFRKLDPDLQDRLIHQAFNYCGSCTIVKEAILKVQTEECLELLLNGVRCRNQQRISIFLGELLKIDSQNEKLCEYLSSICGHSETKEWGKRAFNGDNTCPASIEQMEKAVLKFKRQFFLLSNLGIVSEDDYLKKLQCSSEDLEKIGIFSWEDLLPLKVESLSDMTPLILDFEPPQQVQLEERREKILELLQYLSSILNGTGPFDGGYGYRHGVFSTSVDNGFDQSRPWHLLKSQFKERKASIEKKCESLEEFSKNYLETIADYDVLMGLFIKIDREYQIAKLHAYTDQNGLDRTWAELNAIGIHSLSVSAERENWRPYHVDSMIMGGEFTPHSTDHEDVLMNS